jgi:hypothetical protein
MVVVTDIKGIKVYSARGALSVSAGAGMHSIGQSFLGDSEFYKGIYRMHPNVPKGKMQLMVSYTPSNPQTIKQQNNRQLFSSFVNLWQTMTPEEKMEWRTKASKRGRSGYHFFLSHMMKQTTI